MVSSSLAGVLVTFSAVGEAEQRASLGGLVRGADLVPRVPGGAERLRGAFPVVLGQPDPAVGELDGSLEDGRPAAVDLILVGDRLELVGGLPSAPQLARRERDLDLSGEAPGAAQRIELLVRERPPDRRAGRVDLTLRQP